MEEIISGVDSSVAAAMELQPREGEGLFAWLSRTAGAVDREAVTRLLGSANPFKEGDAAIGVAAADDSVRQLARVLLGATTLRDVDTFQLFEDDLGVLLESSLEMSPHASAASWTFDELRTFLLTNDEASIHSLATGLSSVVIGCVVKLMSDDELTAVSAKLFNVLPRSEIGARGQLGARLQPNSPTDHPDDIRWQVFCGWAYGVGDVLLGTNPVSSEVASVDMVERTLRDVIETFDLTDVLPHCVLSHIDVQAEVERRAPGSTALWFQSIAGSDAANQTFDVSVQKMVAHAAARTGRFSFYFETGQGADFTNGHGRGIDMVLHESRKYGFARALTARVAAAQRDAGVPAEPWVIVNDVAGFIGPEVFRTREQLVRCCLEDLVMGKLHGLTIGLDVCATLHMDISLDDLDWCLERVMPASPAYLMALPTKVDPMLGYLTTGFQDHVRLRETFGRRINAPMQAFFEQLDVLNEAGAPGPHFGDVMSVFVAYQRRRGDVRDDEAVRAEGARQLAEVRGRGVFVAEGFGERVYDVAPALDVQIRGIYDDAKLAFWAQLPAVFVESLSDVIVLETRSGSREEYILHPTSGEELSLESVRRVEELRDGRCSDAAADVTEVDDVQLIVSDGLNALAIAEPGQLQPFLDALRGELSANGWRVAPELLVMHSGRVRAGYRVGEVLYKDRTDRCAVVHVIGERPGTGHQTFSAYLTVAECAAWAVPGRVDHDITRVISGIATTALAPVIAAGQAARVLTAMR